MHESDNPSQRYDHNNYNGSGDNVDNETLRQLHDGPAVTADEQLVEAYDPYVSPELQGAAADQAGLAEQDAPPVAEPVLPTVGTETAVDLLTELLDRPEFAATLYTRLRDEQPELIRLLDMYAVETAEPGVDASALVEAGLLVYSLLERQQKMERQPAPTEASDQLAALEEAHTIYRHMQPRHSFIEDGILAVGQALSDPELEALYDAVDIEFGVVDRWSEVPSTIGGGRYFVDAEDNPRYTARVTKLLKDEYTPDNPTLVNPFLAIRELTVAPYVAEAVASFDVQEAVRAHGFAGISFVEPVAGIVDLRAGTETVIYPYREGFTADVQPEGISPHSPVISDLRRALSGHGLWTSYIDPEQLAVVTDEAGEQHLYLHDGSSFELVP